MKDDPAYKKLVKKATKMPNAIKQSGCEPEAPKTNNGFDFGIEQPKLYLQISVNH